MPQVLQAFTLVSRSKGLSEGSQEAKRVLVTKLRQRGYTVLTSNGCVNGVPEKIMVGGEMDSPAVRDRGIDEDVADVAQTLEVRFKAKTFFIEPLYG